jgi:hypothetical protein
MKKIVVIFIGMAMFFTCADYDLQNDGYPSDTKLFVSDIQDQGVVLRWSRCTDDNFKSYRVYVDTTDVVDFNDRLVDSLSFSQDTVKTVTNLKPSTVYCFRILVVNSAGKTTPSNTVSAVTRLAISSQLSCDSAIILKTTPVRNYSVSSYRIFADTNIFVDTLDPLVSSDTILIIKNLAAGTVMRYRAYAINNYGYIASSNIVTVNGWHFTLYSPDSVSETSIKLHWKRANGAMNYRVYRDTKIPVDTTGTPGAAVSDTSVIIDSLIKGTTYMFKVYAQNGDGAVRAWTNSVSFKMK